MLSKTTDLRILQGLSSWRRGLQGAVPTYESECMMEPVAERQVLLLQCDRSFSETAPEY